MSYQVFWKTGFVGLRSWVSYTVKIWKDGTLPSGYPLTLKCSGEPFMTQEDDDADMFVPVRTQSGYLRIVDDGTAVNANGQVVSFDWRTMVPMTDTELAVTLEGNGVVVWQGFIQSRNFGATLYGEPQVRELPLQCVLTVTEGTDVSYEHREMENFAYLLEEILSSIPCVEVTDVVVQGGSDAQSWLLTNIDWQNFSNVDSDGDLSPRFKLYQCLEDLCKFWGWTARTFGRVLYLTCADDTVETTFLTLTRAQLRTMAGGVAAGTTGSGFNTVLLTGGIFASTDTVDFQDRGVSTAIVKSDGNSGDADVVMYVDNIVVMMMKDLGWQGSEQHEGKVIQYTQPLYAIARPLLVGTAIAGSSSFNVAHTTVNGESNDWSVIRILKTYDGNVLCSLESRYEHVFDDGWLELHGDVYRYADRYEDLDDSHSMKGVGKKRMYVRLGIGESRASAHWYTGSAWGSSVSSFKVSIGNSDDGLCVVTGGSIHSGAFYKMAIPVTGLCGRIFIDFLGSDDLDDIDGKKTFELSDFSCVYQRNTSMVVSNSSSQWGGARNTVMINRADEREYESYNNNSVCESWNSDLAYASDNDMSFGYGVVLKADKSGYLSTVAYGNRQLIPEQHLADRVTHYWRHSRRRIDAELLVSAVTAVTPGSKVVLDNTTLYAVSIGRDWRDDVWRGVLLELDQ